MAYNILVRIHEYIEAIISRLPQDLNGMLDPFFVVFPWPSRLNCLPSKYISDGIVTPLLQPGEVDMGIPFGEGAGVKVDIISIKKLVGNVRWQVGRAGILCIPSEVDSSESYLTAMGVAELAILNGKPQWHTVHTQISKLGYSEVSKRGPSGSSLRGVARSVTRDTDRHEQLDVAG